MLGRATFTIETSSRVMNPAARTTASAFQRTGSGRYSSCPGDAGRVEAAEATDRVDMPPPCHRAQPVAPVLHPGRLAGLPGAARGQAPESPHQPVTRGSAA